MRALEAADAALGEERLDDPASASRRLAPESLASVTGEDMKQGD